MNVWNRDIRVDTAWLQSRPFRFFASLALFITAVAVFVPFAPSMPASGLDPSWALAMNQAVAQHLAFGKDVIFTFGPYASVYTHLYSPATAYLMWGGGLYIAISYWLCLTLLLKHGLPIWQVAFCLFLLAVIVLRDVLFLSYPLLAACCAQKLTGPDLASRPRPTMVLLALIFMPFGLLALVKGSVFILCVLLLAVCLVMFLLVRRAALIAPALLAPLASLALCWVLAGQQLQNLSGYFLGTARIISGYTDAMAGDGSLLEILLYWTAALATLLAVYRAGLPRGRRVFYAAVFFLFFGISFKAGFVRHDIHAISGGTGALFAALLLPAVVQMSRPVIVALSLGALSWACALGSHVDMPLQQLLSNVSSTYGSLWSGMAAALRGGQPYRDGYDAALADLRRRWPLPPLSGTTDIYSYDQAFLFASPNDWDPRPVFQSYSAYTPELAAINLRHLSGPEAPDNVVFDVQPIDGRLPSLEDGPSWPALLGDYTPVAMSAGHLFLRRGVASRPGGNTVVATAAHSFGEWVTLPAAPGAIFATITVKPTLAGDLANILFKPDQLRILLSLANGRKAVYRLVPGMARAGFIISPLVENTAEFALLYGDAAYLSDKTVRAFAVEPASANSFLWRRDYTVSFTAVTHPADAAVLKLFNFDAPLADVSRHHLKSAPDCMGSIDAVNGASPAQAPLSASGVLRVQGWLAGAVTDHRLPDAALVVLTASNGQQTFIRASEMFRPDVAAHFQQAVLGLSGYTATVDLSHLQGHYTLGLAALNGDDVILCPHFAVALDIGE